MLIQIVIFLFRVYIINDFAVLDEKGKTIQVDIDTRGTILYEGGWYKYGRAKHLERRRHSPTATAQQYTAGVKSIFDHPFTHVRRKNFGCLFSNFNLFFEHSTNNFIFP